MLVTPLRKARLEARMTISEVSEVVGCDKGNLSRLERGINRPTPELAEKLAILFSPKISELEILYPERFPHPAPDQEAQP